MVENGKSIIEKDPGRPQAVSEEAKQALSLLDHEVVEVEEPSSIKRIGPDSRPVKIFPGVKPEESSI